MGGNAHMSQLASFSGGEFVVYPTHGVGKLESVETQQVAGLELKVLVITFQKSRMTLRLPMAKAQSAGLRRLGSREDLDTAFSTLTRRIKAKKGVWARRAQEYELKINSGNLTSVAEVLCELYRCKDDRAEQSYSERQIYRSALERLCAEVALIEAIDEDSAAQRVEDVLARAA